MKDLYINNIEVSYDTSTNTNMHNKNKISVLKDFSIKVKSGELLVVLGPSGCGKSTLLSAISGLKKPSHGKIIYGDECYYSKDKRINLPCEQRNIGFVFQSYALWPHLSVYQNIAFPLKTRKYGRYYIEHRVDKILDIVHMSGYKDRYPNELSGGEKQRIALARSLVYDPSLLLLDEPLANLDANLKTKLVKEIKSIQKALGVTTIYVTHDQAEAFEVADRIVIMNEGIIVQQGTPKQIYQQSQNEFSASFIGKNNIFPCGKRCRPNYLKTCHKNRTVTIRPEDIKIYTGGEYCGEIVDVSYKGDRLEVMIRSDNENLKAWMPGDSVIQKGDKVYFDIQRYHLI